MVRRLCRRHHLPHLVHPLFVQTVVGPNINKVRPTKAVVDNVLTTVRPKIFGYLGVADRGQISGRDTMTLADVAITSNFVVYQYLGFEIDPGQYPKLAKVPPRHSGDRGVPARVGG